jgi:polyhydroxybutyrate depolymerase
MHTGHGTAAVTPDPRRTVGDDEYTAEMRRTIVVLTCLIFIAACSSDGTGGTTVQPTATVAETASSAAASATAPTTQAAAATTPPDSVAPATSTTVEPSTTPTPSTVDPTANRPYDVFVPSSYNSATPAPLVILLHGYTATGAVQEAYFQLQPSAEQRGFLYVHPDGTKDAIGNGFWNATNACCDLLGTGVDDVAYLSAIIDQVQAKYNVDPKRIYLVGHSNGGFMSYRMACDRADKIAAIVSVAGATFADAAACKPSQPVSVLQIHGTADGTISYDGGQIRGNAFPSAPGTVAEWAAYDGCSPTPAASATTLDLERNLDGAETSVSQYTGCLSGSTVELWTVNGGAHIPAISESFAPSIIDFLYAHPKP